MNARRLFVLEPFLRQADNHFIEVACSLNQELSARSADYAIVGHVTVDRAVRELLPMVVPAIEQTAFENLDDMGRSFLHDLRNLDDAYHFDQHDTVIIPTAYENQILAAEDFVRGITTRAPGIAMMFHQAFPPSADSTDLWRPSFRQYWKDRLRKAFARSSSLRVSYWTTESQALNRLYRGLSGRNVGMLPIPFQRFPEFMQTVETRSAHRRMRIGFLGEARQEKGLHLFLDAVRLLEDRADKYTFVVQLNRLRGYGSTALGHMEKLVTTIRARDNVEVREGALRPAEQHQLISSLDLLVLPYDPFNYCRRLSALAAEAAVYGVPVLGSSGTWTARAIRDGLLSGDVFSYKRSSQDTTARNLADSLTHCSWVRSACTAGAHFRDSYTASEFVRRICAYYQ